MPDGLELRADGLGQFRNDFLDRAHDRDVGRAVLGNFRRVDVRVDDLGVRGEGLQDAGDAVIEARAERDQQVGLLQGGHGGDRAVHARHADVLRVRVRERRRGPSAW